MRQKRSVETDEQRRVRFELRALAQTQAKAAEDQDIDAMVRRSIALHGP